MNNILDKENNSVSSNIYSNDENQYVSDDGYVPIYHKSIDNFKTSAINPDYIDMTNLNLDGENYYNNFGMPITDAGKMYMIPKNEGKR